MSKHTPGPWYVEDSGNSSDYQEPILHISPENGFGERPIFRAKLTMFPARKTKIGAPRHCALVDECEANARLIAAAPDLLAKCEKIVAWLDRLAASSDAQARDTRFMSLSEACAADAKNYRKTADDIRSVIAKATGEAA